MNPIRERLTDSVQDYLKVIYDLTAGGERVTTNQIADRLDIAPASVTGMVQKLASFDPPLVEYRKHHGVLLTPEGEKAALEVIRHHRLLELFLQERLGYPWDEVHAEADRLEHVISEDFEERIAQSLGDPLRDPHGDPIPTRDLQVPASSDTRLCELRPNQRASVRRVDSTDTGLLRHLSGLGLVPRARLLVVEHSPFDDNLSMQINGHAEPIVLGPGITSRIFVEVIT
jgi:DtxR family Mn-dependent transcriptional regulator